jgi:hypothetical protein
MPNDTTCGSSAFVSSDLGRAIGSMDYDVKDVKASSTRVVNAQQHSGTHYELHNSEVEIVTDIVVMGRRYR